MKEEIKKIVDGIKRKITNGASDYPKVKGLKVKNNRENNKIELKFKNRPNKIVRDYLKQSGYVYDNSNKSWNANLNENNKEQTKRIMYKLK